MEKKAAKSRNWRAPVPDLHMLPFSTKVSSRQRFEAVTWITVMISAESSITHH
jgi:hypothetical protein